VHGLYNRAGCDRGLSGRDHRARLHELRPGLSATRTRWPPLSGYLIPTWC
jgi:hypothetical protein